MSGTTEARQTVFTGTGSGGTVGDSIFRHLILFKMYEGTTQETIDEALRLMVAMCQTSQVARYEVAVSEDTRKGVILIEHIDFPSKDAFEEFKTTQAHTDFANFIRNYADWIIGDYTVHAN